MENQDHGILDHSQFNFTILAPSNSRINPLPSQILIGGYCFGENLDIVLTQIEGNSLYIKSRVWQINGENLDQAPSNKIVSLLLILFFNQLLK